MERKINKKIEEAFANYKQDIKTGIVGVITAINCQIDEEYVSDIMLSYSSTHRKFIEERLKYSKNELSKSEVELKEFSEKNPFAVDTPELQLQRGRLLRNMEVNQQVYITLRQQYEMARINELKEIPVINILDYAEPASDESKPQKLLILLLSNNFA